ncbi:insulinoma-associated protein 1 [Stomoxys calcitrans]|uniref:insulinoma-associated protein 1 n=1 Tax=Stomoxys calcitrans TaxID=35570 RepID=UPI0027E28C15|nr:insulinoma-associated protein 1 [Stomoxys calcitrans]
MAAATQQQQQLHHHHHHTHSNSPNNLQVLHGHSIQGMPHGLGLLTTVASLPPKYRSRYLKIQTKCEIPLDLSVKPLSPHTETVTTSTTTTTTPPTPTPCSESESEVPMAVNFTEVYTEPCSDTQSQASEDIVEQICSSLEANNEAHTNPKSSLPSAGHNKPMTPPLTPNSKRKFSESDMEDLELEYKENHNKIMKVEDAAAQSPKQPLVENTPAKQPIKSLDTAPKTSKNQSASTEINKKSNRSNKATRKLKFDEETSSPVSGTIIRPLEDITDGTMQYSNGDIDPKYNIVEITEETKAELAAIKNVIGDYICRLCRIKFDDAFGLAQHRCACIVLLEYRCPECGKQFNCPANLASHRRWHKPRKTSENNQQNPSASAANKTESREKKSSKKTENEGSETCFDCQECGKKFKRQAYLKKHQLVHQKQAMATQNGQTTVLVSPAAKTAADCQVSYLPNTTTTSTTQHQTSPTAAALPQNEEIVYTSTAAHTAPPPSYSEYENEDDSMSGYSSSVSSSSNHHYGRLQIVETGLTEEENIAAAALTNLRNCASVIQHTTLAH